MNRVLILVEGQTEEQFAKNILAPYYWDYNVSLVPTILKSKRNRSGPDFKGGVTSFAKFERDLRELLRDSEASMITTFLDYYALPSDFPGTHGLQSADPYQSVAHLEMAIKQHFTDPRFHPFLMLHEFEALLFADPDTVATGMNDPAKAQNLHMVRDNASGPEKVNNSQATHPSARISLAFPRYQKVIDGLTLVSQIGLPKILQECPHFKQWHDTLRDLGRSP